MAGLLLGAIAAAGQTAPAKTPGAATAAAVPGDASLDAAEALIGRALFVRGSYQANDLAYDAAGQVQGAPKAADWTLAGIDVKRVERRGPKEIMLEGVRVAIRYNQDNHQFERHPQAEEKMRVLVADAGDEHRLETALDAVFAQGIDPRMQRSMPAYWQHYFNPALDWPADALTSQTVYTLNGGPNPAKDVTPPSIAHKVDLKMTGQAEKDRVHGTLVLRVVVDPEGVPQRIAVARPLGYGLEERTVEMLAKWRFTPATREGKPVAASLLVNYDVEFATPPHP